MEPFGYLRADDEKSALGAGAAGGAVYIAGGTSLVDLMRLGVEKPATVVDIARLPYSKIDDLGGELRIGALVRNSDLARHPLVVSRYRALSEALLSGASPQLRNMATVGGNVLQRTRCPYFRNLFPSCNKRTPGTGCAAFDGQNREHAILGGGEHCIAVHPSDMCVALVAFDAVVHTSGRGGARQIPLVDFHLLPAAHPEHETALAPGELITHVSLPLLPFFSRSRYLKVRDRASYDFALASAAVALDVADGSIENARIALGGVATKPWRSREAEQALVGQKPDRAAFERAAEVALRGAAPRAHNRFKVALSQRTLIRALESVETTA